MKVILVLAPLLLWVACSSGCVAVVDHVDDVSMGLRDHCEACRAWVSCQPYVETNYPHDYGKGFRAGYRDVAGGGKGCPPMLPPRWYWATRYQNPVGREQVSAWFDGFVVGAAVAEGDGVKLRNQLPTAAHLYQNNCPVPPDVVLPPELLPEERPALELLPAVPPAERPADDYFPPGDAAPHGGADADPNGFPPPLPLIVPGPESHSR